MSENSEAFDALCIKPDDIIDYEVKTGNKAYPFKLKVVPWKFVEKLRSDCTLIDRQTRTTHTLEDQYQDKLLNEVIVSGPFEPADKAKFITSLKLDVKDAIIKRIGQLHSLPEETAKN